MPLRTDGISGLWPMLILDSSPTATCKLVWWYSQLCRVFRWRGTWVKILYQDPVPWSFFPRSHKQSACFHHSLRPAAELCLMQAQRRKIKKGHIRLCFLSGMPWKQPFWEQDKSFTHLSSWGCLGSVWFWHLAEQHCNGMLHMNKVNSWEAENWMQAVDWCHFFS